MHGTRKYTSNTLLLKSHKNTSSIGLWSGFSCTLELKNDIMIGLKMLLPLCRCELPGAWTNLIRRLIMDTLPPHDLNGNIPLKRCRQCPEGQQWHPATAEHFHRQKDKKDGLASRCKDCHNRKQREKYRQPDEKEKRHTRYEAYYAQPEVRERRLAQQKIHRSLPEAKKQRKDYHDLYMSRPEVQERRRAYLKDYMDRPGKREKARAKVRRYQSKPEVQERRKAYANRPEVRKKMRFNEKVYRDTPKGQFNSRTKQQNREARKKAIQGTHTPAQIQEQLRRQKYRCYYAACGHSKFQRVKKNGSWVYTGYEIEHTYPVSRVVGMDIPANAMGYLVLSCPTCNRRKQDKFPWEWPEGGRLL